MKKTHYTLPLLCAALLLLGACHNRQGGQQEEEAQTTAVNVPAFNADSAYAYTAQQVAFGPRIPNTDAQEKCAAWLTEKMKAFADTVTVQRTTVTGPGNQSLRCINIIGHVNPSAKMRTLLLAHWDTRPFADGADSSKNRHFDGADDGASGAAVLLEIARQLKQQKPEVGVDILLSDVEDSGVENDDGSWALGTRYWAQQARTAGYRAQYGILLDMVGGRGSHYYIDAASQQLAGLQAKMVWDVANSIGYSDFFRYENKGQLSITDDHIPVNQIAGIPTLDIVALRPNRQDDKIFPTWHHTVQDNMDIIDKSTLKAVGQTVLHVLYTNPSY
ncbi:M28 family peptidase [Compostibacter hankyongensis]